MGIRRFFLTDAFSIIETATTESRQSHSRAVGSGANWSVEATLNRGDRKLRLAFQANGNTASSLISKGWTLNIELSANGKSVRQEVEVNRWVDFFVYHGFNTELDYADLGDINDISDIRITLL